MKQNVGSPDIPIFLSKTAPSQKRNGARASLWRALIALATAPGLSSCINAEISWKALGTSGPDLNGAYLRWDPPPPVAALAYGNDVGSVITLRNIGKLEATDINLGGLSAPFSDGGTTCGATLAAGASCTFTVGFNSPGLGNYSTSISARYKSGSTSFAATTQLDAQGLAVTGLTVAPVYTSNGRDWNKYIRFSNTAATIHGQTDTACTGAETGGYSKCIHGAELRSVAFAGLSDCADVTAEDELGAFDWICISDVLSNKIVSTRLKAGKHLSDLIDVGSNLFRLNKVTIKKAGIVIGETGSSTWWSNGIYPLPDNSADGAATILLDQFDDDGAGPDQAYSAIRPIFHLASSRASSGYIIGDIWPSIVIMPGVSLSYNGNATANCSPTTAESAAATTQCLIAVPSNTFNWFEGTFDAEGGAIDALHAILAVGTDFSVFDNVTAYNGRHSGIKLADSENNKLQKIRTARNSIENSLAGALNISGGRYNSVDDFISTNDFGHGILIQSTLDNSISNFSISRPGSAGINMNLASYNRLVTGRIVGAVEPGINLSSANSNTISQVTISNGFKEGIQLISGTDNTVTGITCSGTASCVLSLGGTHNTVAFSTAANSFGTFATHAGFSLTNTSEYTTFYNLVAINGATSGFLIGGAGDHSLAQIVSANNVYGVDINFGPNDFSMNLVTNDNSLNDCLVTDATGGLLDTTCFRDGTSTSNHFSGLDLTSTFVGKVTTNDSTNPSDSAGAQAFDSINDWLNFDTIFRAWSADGGAFPAATNQDICATGDQCRIWDWRIRNTDTNLLNRSMAVTTANDPFVPRAACPALLSGAEYMADQQTPTQIFHKYAIEILHDKAGDDDGLCEEDEKCVYAPNFGSYQGEGDLTDNTCTFTDGTLSGITMHAYPTNGAP